MRKKAWELFVEFWPRFQKMVWTPVGFMKDGCDAKFYLSPPRMGMFTRHEFPFIDLAQVDVSDIDHKGVSQGWPKYYWKPWRKALGKG